MRSTRKSSRTNADRSGSASKSRSNVTAAEVSRLRSVTAKFRARCQPGSTSVAAATAIAAQRPSFDHPDRLLRADRRCHPEHEGCRDEKYGRVGNRVVEGECHDRQAAEKDEEPFREASAQQPRSPDKRQRHPGKRELWRENTPNEPRKPIEDDRPPFERKQPVAELLPAHDANKFANSGRPRFEVRAWPSRPDSPDCAQRLHHHSFSSARHGTSNRARLRFANSLAS